MEIELVANLDEDTPKAGTYCMLDGFKGTAEAMASMANECAIRGCPSCINRNKSLSDMLEAKYGKKVNSVESLQCSECNEVSVTLLKGTCNTCLSKVDDEDVINWPKHYNACKIQPIDVIEDWKLDFRLANAVKYIQRHEHKGSAQKDLEKAIWYIQRYIDKELTKEESNG